MTEKSDLNTDALKHVAGKISAGLPRDLSQLLSAWKSSYKLSLRTSKDGVTTCKMLGVDAKSRQGDHGALKNWSNAARRAMLQAA